MSTTGCNGGFLTDPRAYFFSLIGRTIGSPAPDWKAVLEDLHFQKGMWKNPAPGAPVAANAPFYGITMMIDAGGNARGRGWLPSDQFVVDGSGNKWYTREIQFIDDAPGGGLQWAWIDKGGAQYTPRACDGGTIPVPPDPQPPSNDLENRVKLLEAKVERQGDKIVSLQGEVDDLREELGKVSQGTMTKEQILALVAGAPVYVKGKAGYSDVIYGREMTWVGKVGNPPTKEG